MQMFEVFDRHALFNSVYTFAINTIKNYTYKHCSKRWIFC